MSKLVIVESPNKIKSIEKYLGKEYKVMASVGHIVRLPNSGEHRFGVDMSTWEPQYKIDTKKKDVVEALKKAAKPATEIFIATDPDREGEAIADNLVTFLHIAKKYKRIRFNEITEGAVKAAIESPTIIDNALVEAQITRRILDRIIGYKLSGLMRQKIQGAPLSPSAGRVQSIALKLIVEREKEIKAFVPVPYTTIEAKINDEVSAFYYSDEGYNGHKEWIDPKMKDGVVSQNKGTIKVVDRKVTIKKSPKVTPFKQAVLYKRADSRLGLSSKSVQRAAQKLYEGYGDGGLITYPRTDSTRLSEGFVKKAKEYIEKKYGKEYVATDIKGTAGSQDAHESIRPTNINLHPAIVDGMDKLTSQEKKVYRLIWNNTIQALMSVPKKEMLRYNLVEGENKYKMTSSKVIFDGYFKAIGYKAEKELPKFDIGEVISVAEYIVEDKETQPPARYNDGSLIEKLDELGVGRPSTFATTVSILVDRAYADKQGKALVPTEFGFVVNKKLQEAFSNIINEEYTAHMEEDLDKISEGNLDYKKLLDKFWKDFQGELQTATLTLEITKVVPTLAGKKCPLCGSELLVKRNKRDGSRFFGCSKFPECKHVESDPNAPRKRRWFDKKK